MKILTAVIVLMVLGGGTAATVATVGNVDWDAWHLQSHHHEDMHYNGLGYRFSNIHTDPELNEEDGLYYSVTKLEIHNQDGMMVLIPSLSSGSLDYEIVDDGIIVYSKFGSDNDAIRDCLTFFPGVYLQGMTVTTYPSMRSGTDCSRELCEKYGLQGDLSFHTKHYNKNGNDLFQLYTNIDGSEVLVDGNFDYRKETMTVNGILLSETSTVEIQHITETKEECFESVQTTEDLLNAVMYNKCVRVVDSVTDAELVEEKNEEKNYDNQSNRSYTWEGVCYTIENTEPKLNESDGKYHSVTKLKIIDDGEMVFTDTVDNEFVHETVGDGVVFSRNNGTEYQLLISGASVQTMTVTTYADMSRGTEYNRELCEKYGLSDMTFTIRTFVDGSGKAVHLFANVSQYNEDGTCSHYIETEVDDNFTPRMETVTLEGIVLTQSGVIEIQHEGSTAEEVAADAESAENLLNNLICSSSTVFVESASA